MDPSSIENLTVLILKMISLKYFHYPFIKLNNNELCGSLPSIGSYSFKRNV